jgi:hypothetical protein
MDKFLTISIHLPLLLFILLGSAAQRRLWPPVALPPSAGYGLLVHEGSCSHTTTRHSRYDSSVRVISSSQKPLPGNTHYRQTSMSPVGFFFYLFYIRSFRVLFVQLSLLSYHTAGCGFFHYEKSDGFGRERTRDLGFQRSARKPLDHRSRWFRTHDRSRWAGVDLRPRPRGHWDRHSSSIINKYSLASVIVLNWSNPMFCV